MEKSVVTLFSILIVTALFVTAMPREPLHQIAAGSGWNIYTVTHIGDDVNGWTSIALDDNDWPYIVYYNLSGDSLELANWNSSGWRIQTIDKQVADRHFDTGVSLALDKEGHPRIGYADHDHSDLKYAEWTGSTWVIQTIEDSVYSGFAFVSMALDGKGFPHISYYDRAHYDLKHAKWNGSAWTTETIDSMGYVGLWTSIDLDKNDNPHIGYHNTDLADLRYASWNGTAWKIETVDEKGSVGMFSSMKLDSSDHPHISYLDLDNSDLKYATWIGSAWKTETVDSLGVVGYYTSIAIDSSDHPYISYFANPNDFNLQRLKHAEWNGSAWNIEVADVGPGVGWFTSIAVDSMDLPHISFLGWTPPYSVKYATKSDLSPRPKPSLSYAPNNLDYGNLSPRVVATKTFEIWNSGGRSLSYGLSENIPWVTSISPSDGSSAGEHDNITVSIDTTGLPPSLHTGIVSITSNGGNGTVQVSVNISVPTRHVNLNIDPDTLNKKSRGKWITAYLTVENASPCDIDPSSLLLNNLVQPSWWDVQSKTTLMVKFDRATVQAILPISETVDIEVTGQWKDGLIFEVHDIVRVISPGR